MHCVIPFNAYIYTGAGGDLRKFALISEGLNYYLSMHCSFDGWPLSPVRSLNGKAPFHTCICIHEEGKLKLVNIIMHFN